MREKASQPMCAISDCTQLADLRVRHHSPTAPWVACLCTHHAESCTDKDPNANMSYSDIRKIDEFLAYEIINLTKEVERLKKENKS